MADGSLADLIADDPAGAWYALDCLDARESLHDFCGFVELPGVAQGQRDDGSPLTADDDEDDDAIAFAEIVRPTAAHHRLMIDVLERVERGELRRVMFFLPPGSAKSTYGSVAFPAWYMGRKKGRNVGVATYATTLARKIGRRVRSIVRQKRYQDVFGLTLAADQGAADEWALTNGNEFMGAGILAGWTGNRLDGIVIDDPVKNREDASSPQIQTKTKEEYDATINTRLKPGGWVVLIQTRWDEDDLAGQILPEEWDGESGDILCRDGLVWHVVCIPAEAEENDPLGRKPGEMLWPEWFGKDPIFWTNARNNAATWYALYQQRPSGREGSFFMRSWFRRYRPADIEGKLFRKYMASDHAPTEGEDSDPSTCRVFGVDAPGDLFYLDGFSHRADMSVTADRIVGNLKDPGREADRPAIDGLIRKHQPFAWFPEDDNNWKSAAPFIRKRMREEGVLCRIEPISPHGHDKAVKAQSAQGMAASGRVWVPEGPEGDAIIEQLVKFPTGRHDEEVDVLAIMCRAIAMAHPAVIPPAPAEPLGPPKGINDMTMNQLLEMQTPKRDRV